jgi:serine/threonine protein kinase
VQNINNHNNDVNLPTTTAEAHFMEQEFYNEISLYSSLKNKHIANLIGVHTSTKNDDDDDDMENDNDDCGMSMLTEDVITSNPLSQCMIFEHLNNGDLHEYLIQRASSNSATVYNGMMMLAGSQSNLSAASSIGGASSNYLNLQQQQRNIADFLYIGQQIASGMEYLASQNFILKDLATRNILMSDNLTIKISIDLIAQYKETYAKDYYKFQMKTLPVRWMSPESLLYGRYTQQSDVWSYGVCLWEIFNYGCQPYSGCTNPEAIEMIRDRQLLLIPDECPQRAYALMLECWHETPTQRPTFTDILNRLRNWENYYLFNNQINNNFVPPLPSIPQQQQQQQQQQMPPPLPLPMHLQNSQQTVPLFQMTSSYSSNSQNSKASSLLGNGTASTGISNSCSPPPLPPPLQINQNGLFCTTNPMNPAFYSSPSKNLTMQNSTNIFASKFGNSNNMSSPPPPSSNNNNNNNVGKIYRDLDPANSLRLSQRNFHQQSTFNSNLMGNQFPNGVNTNNINDQFEL